MDAEGMVHVPRERPGLGVDVDVEFIESLTTRSEVLSHDREAVPVG